MPAEKLRTLNLRDRTLVLASPGSCRRSSSRVCGYNERLHLNGLDLLETTSCYVAVESPGTADDEIEQI
jgi:hypothetical protein